MKKIPFSDIKQKSTGLKHLIIFGWYSLCLSAYNKVKDFFKKKNRANIDGVWIIFNLSSQILFLLQCFDLNGGKLGKKKIKEMLTI